MQCTLHAIRLILSKPACCLLSVLGRVQKAATFLQEAASIDKQLASVALGQFKSCVRTTLLLCDGYECQETDGAFLIAFNSPRAALEWALCLQAALLR